MKILKFILLFASLSLLVSCYDEAKISVQNNISGAKLADIAWGDAYLEYELLPGETSDKITITEYNEKLPASHKISFIMTVNQKSIYLETEEKYLLAPDDDILIILADSTKVSNPNE